MLVNTFLRLPEGTGKRGLSTLSPLSNVVDRRGDVRGEVIDAIVRGRFEKRDEMELDVERLERGDWVSLSVNDGGRRTGDRIPLNVTGEDNGRGSSIVVCPDDGRPRGERGDYVIVSVNPQA